MQAEASCDHTSISVPTTHDGEYDVKVLVHTPKVSHCYHAGLGWAGVVDNLLPAAIFHGPAVTRTSLFFHNFICGFSH